MKLHNPVRTEEAVPRDCAAEGGTDGGDMKIWWPREIHIGEEETRV